MTAGDLAAGGARAVLFGTGRYAPDSELAALPAVDATLGDLHDTLVLVCGMDPAQVTRVPADAGPTRVVAAVEAAVREAVAGPVLFCYTGHGLLGPGDELYLATRAVRSADEVADAVPYRVVRDLLGEAPRGSLVILDCCFSGVADPPPASGGTRGPFVTAGARGSFLLTSASHYDLSFAPEGERHTLFTGRLLRLLGEGDPAGPLLLTADHLHAALEREFAEDPRVRPARSSEGTLGSLVLARNRAYREDHPATRHHEPPADLPCPYPGPEPFRVGHSAWFFGRDELADRLTALLEQDGDDVPVVLVGASGAGKSSLLRAGLLGRLDSHPAIPHPALLLPAPGPHPVRALAEVWAQATGRNAEKVCAALYAGRFPGPRRGRRACRLLVVDQFEEVFTRCEDTRERAAFISLLTAAGTDSGGGTPSEPAPRHQWRPRVVLGLRADHYGSCLGHPGLERALVLAQLPVPPLREAELRDAIEGPAAAAGLTVEAGLTNRLVQDAREGRSPDEAAGVMPFLAHALRETWLRRSGALLTLAGYQGTGGIWQSVAVTTEDLYDSLDADGRAAMRELLLRLVYLPPDGGAAVLRHQVPLGEVPSGAAAICDRLVAKRLLTVGQGTVQIAHESLLRSWPRLRQWAEEDAATLLLRQRLSAAAAEWDAAGRDATYLYRGSRLQAAAGIVGDHHLRDVEREFIAAAEEADEQEALRGRRRVQVLRRLLAVTATALCLAVVAAFLAVREQHTAEAQQRAAVTRALLAEAAGLAADDPRSALKLQLAANALRPGADTRRALFTTLDRNPFRGASALGTSHTILQAPAFSPDARTLVAQEGRGAVSVWDTGGATVARRPRARLPCQEPSRRLPATAVGGPHGRIVAAACGETDVNVWDLARVRHGESTRAVATLRLDGPPDGPTAVAVSADGRLVAAVGWSPSTAEGALAIWNIAGPGAPRPLSVVRDTAGGEDRVETAAVRFTPDGRHLVTAGSDLRMWDVSDPARPQPEGSVTGASGVVAVSPDGHTVATTAGILSRTVRLVDFASPSRPRVLARYMFDHADRVESLAFSPDGNQLASGDAGHDVVLTEVSDPKATDNSVTLTGHRWGVDALAFASRGTSGTTLVSASSIGDEVVRWNPADLRSRRLLTAVPSARLIALVPDGTLLATAIGVTIRLWDVSNPAAPRQVAVRAADKGDALAVTGLAVSADGTLLAAITDSSRVTLWDTTHPTRPRLVGTLKGDGGSVGNALALSPHGRLLATDYGGRTRVWDVSDPAHPREKAATKPGAGNSALGSGISFTPDGCHVLVSGSLTLWNYAAGKRIPLPTTTTPLYRGIAAVSPDGGLVAAAPQTKAFTRDDWSGLQLWDIRDPGAPRSASGDRLPDSDAPQFHRLAFHPAGDMVAGAAEDGTVRLWSIADPDHPYLADTFERFEDQVNDVAIGGPGNRLMVSTSGGNAFLWNLGDLPRAAASPDAMACEVAGGGFGPDEWTKRIPDTPFRRTCPET